jgi:hypothetical protein
VPIIGAGSDSRRVTIASSVQRTPLPSKIPLEGVFKQTTDGSARANAASDCACVRSTLACEGKMWWGGTTQEAVEADRRERRVKLQLLPAKLL